MSQGVQAAAVREEAQRILASSGFTGSARLCGFLRYIVDETLAGRGSLIKEYPIGVEVYKRKPDYDPKMDAIVRVEAGRLRAKLKQYYANEGRESPVRIELPRGTYTPVFYGGGGDAPVAIVTGAPRRVYWFGLALVVVAGAALLFTRISGRKNSPHGLFSLVVLPAINMAGSPGIESFSDGLGDQLTQELSTVNGFQVVSRTAAFQLKGKAIDMASLGRRLRVEAALESSVQESGNRIHVTAQLIATSDGYHLWSEKYESKAGNPLQFQKAVAEVVARTLRSRYAGLDPVTISTRGTRSAEARRLYLAGYEGWLTQRRPGLLKSVELYEKAITADPNYGDAHAGLAAAELFLGSIDDSLDRVRRGKDEAMKALALDDRNDSAHSTLGNIYFFHDWNFAGAEVELKRSLELHPGVSSVERWHAMAAEARGQLTQAVSELKMGELINPESEVIQNELGRAYLIMGMDREAEGRIRQALALDANYRYAQLLLGLILERRGDAQSAVEQFRKCAAIRDDTSCHQALGHIYAASGRTSEAAQTIREIESQPGAYQVAEALVAVARGNHGRALAALERAFELREPQLPYIKTDFRFAPLASEPRFRALIERMGL